MKICIAGLGAIGTYLAARLKSAGAHVSVVVRAAARDAIAETGVELAETNGSVTRARPDVLASRRVGGEPQDWLFICCKAYAVPQLVSDVGHLIGPATRVVFAQNGVPWWYTVGSMESADLVARDRVVGCVAYASVRHLGAGRAQHVGDDRFFLGQPAKARPTNLTPIIEVMKSGGIEAAIAEPIEKAVWVKLWGNLAFNPISSLTGATMDRIIGEANTRPLVMAMMREAQGVAEALGIKFDITIEQRLEMAARAGAFRTSMLQDLEAGRPLEIDAILGSVAALARAVKVDTPSIDTVLGLLSQKLETIEMKRTASIESAERGPT